MKYNVNQCHKEHLSKTLHRSPQMSSSGMVMETYGNPPNKRLTNKPTSGALNLYFKLKKLTT